MNEIYLIGLGNPGKKYSQNRHNIGFQLLQNFSKKRDLEINNERNIFNWIRKSW